MSKPRKTNQPIKGDAVLEGLIDTKHPIRITVAYPFPEEIAIPSVNEHWLVFKLDKILDIPVYHTMSGVMARMFPKARYILKCIDCHRPPK